MVGIFRAKSFFGLCAGIVNMALAIVHIDETYVKVNGRWSYLYRAVDQRGDTIDFYLSSRRNTKSAYCFLGKILNNVKKWQIPQVINTDKAPTYGRALSRLKREGKCPPDLEHRQIKYKNTLYTTKIDNSLK